MKPAGRTVLLPKPGAVPASLRFMACRMAAVDIHAHVFHHDLPFLPRQRYTP